MSNLKKLTTPGFARIIELEQGLDNILATQKFKGAAPAGILAATKEWAEAVWEAAQTEGPMPLNAGQVNTGLRLSTNPVFICGPHRSGTTLVQSLLDGHPSLVVLPSEDTFDTGMEQKLAALPAGEHAFFLCADWLHRLANPSNKPPYWLLGRSTTDTSPYVAFTRYFMAWWQQLEQSTGAQWQHLAVVLAYASYTNNLNAKYWVDKTPMDEVYIARISAEMPKAKFIHCVRNPVDIIASQISLNPLLNLRKALLGLKLSFDSAVEQAKDGSQHYLLLKYEQLCDNTKQVVGQVEVFLGVESSPVLYQPTVAGQPAQSNSSFIGDGMAGQVFALKTHQNALSAADMEVLSAYLYLPAEKLGYTLPKLSFLRKSQVLLKHKLF